MYVPHGMSDENNADFVITGRPGILAYSLPLIHHALFQPASYSARVSSHMLSTGREPVYAARRRKATRGTQPMTHVCCRTYHSRKAADASASSPFVSYLGYTTDLTV